MTEITATEADTRGLSSLLDEVERSGETFVITRHGRHVATVRPAQGGSGKTLKEIMRRHHLDPDFGRDIASVRELLVDQEHPWAV
jgi:antitoxin (DNA-binding transcriptional repressor) of toxin-antitoxin stability system